jgi:hypothetical protein
MITIRYNNDNDNDNDNNYNTKVNHLPQSHTLLGKLRKVLHCLQQLCPIPTATCHSLFPAAPVACYNVN